MSLGLFKMRLGDNIDIDEDEWKEKFDGNTLMGVLAIVYEELIVLDEALEKVRDDWWATVKADDFFGAINIMLSLYKLNLQTDGKLLADESGRTLEAVIDEEIRAALRDAHKKID